MTLADLTYRNYDGPMLPARQRWAIIARTAIRAALGRRSLWIWTLTASAYYLIMLTIIFFMENVGGSIGGDAARTGVDGYIKQLIWKDQMLHAFSTGQLVFMLVGISLGAGAIANDNRANALLVYLARPLTRADYLIGKWIGVWVPLTIVMLLPSLIFYLYGALSYRGYGFILDDPLTLPKFIVAALASSAFLTSLIVGISSMFNQGRIAGATFAGVYFLTTFFTQFMQGMWASNDGDVPKIVGWLYYASVDGLQIGLMKAILGTDGSPIFGAPSFTAPIDRPPLWLVGGAALLLSLLFLKIAHSRIRAVEVV